MTDPIERTPSTVGEELISDARLREIADGCEGVIHGPWRAAESWHPPMNRSLHDPKDIDALGNVFWGYSLSGSSEKGASILPTFGALHNFPDSIHKTAAHVARMDPATVKAMADELLVSRDIIARLSADKAVSKRIAIAVLEHCYGVSAVDDRMVEQTTAIVSAALQNASTT